MRRWEYEHRKEIKKQLIDFTSNLMTDTGLVATNFTGATVVDLPLCKSVPELARPTDDKTEGMAYLTMKHHISINCYKDLAAHCPELPRSHKVHCFPCTISFIGDRS